MSSVFIYSVVYIIFAILFVRALSWEHSLVDGGCRRYSVWSILGGVFFPITLAIFLVLWLIGVLDNE